MPNGNLKKLAPLEIEVMVMYGWNWIFAKRVLKAGVLSCLSALLLIGCGGAMLTPNYAGKQIQPGYQVPIQTGEGSGTLQTDDLTLNYHYVRRGDAIKLQGSVRFADSMDMNFNYIDYFSLSALFADASGRILTSAPLTSANWINLTLLDRQVQFVREIAVPPDTALMAFTYTGQASYGGGGSTGGVNTQFWQYPIMN